MIDFTLRRKPGCWHDVWPGVKTCHFLLMTAAGKTDEHPNLYSGGEGCWQKKFLNLDFETSFPLQVKLRLTEARLLIEARLRGCSEANPSQASLRYLVDCRLVWWGRSLCPPGVRAFTPAAGHQRYRRATLETHKLDGGLSSAPTRWGLRGAGGLPSCQTGVLYWGQWSLLKQICDEALLKICGSVWCNVLL